MSYRQNLHEVKAILFSFTNIYWDYEKVKQEELVAKLVHRNGIYLQGLHFITTASLEFPKGKN